MSCSCKKTSCRNRVCCANELQIFKQNAREVLLSLSKIPVFFWLQNKGGIFLTLQTRSLLLRSRQNPRAHGYKFVHIAQNLNVFVWRFGFVERGLGPTNHIFPVGACGGNWQHFPLTPAICREVRQIKFRKENTFSAELQKRVSLQVYRVHTLNTKTRSLLRVLAWEFQTSRKFCTQLTFPKNRFR